MTTVSKWWAQNRAYFAAYGIWLLAASVGILPLLYGPEPLASLMELIGINRWVISAIQRFSYVFLGLGWLIGVLYAEHYLRASVARQHLGHAIVRVSVVLFVLLLLLALLALVPIFL